MKPPRQRLECCSCKPKIHRLASKSPEAGKIHGRVLPSRFHREHRSTNILISDFQTPELQNNTFLFFEATHFLVLCLGSPRQLLQCVHTVRGPLCLALFPWYDAFKFYPWYCLYSHSCFYMAHQFSVVWIYHILLIHSPVHELT